MFLKHDLFSQCSFTESVRHIHLLSAPKIITELILERAGPVVFKTFLLELMAFKLIPVICPARRAKPENYWKR